MAVAIPNHATVVARLEAVVELLKNHPEMEVVDARVETQYRELTFSLAFRWLEDESFTVDEWAALRQWLL